jgi:hypothetical protein
VIEKQSSQIKQYEQEVQLLNDPATSEEKVDLIEKVIEKEDQEVTVYHLFFSTQKWAKGLKKLVHVRIDQFRIPSSSKFNTCILFLSEHPTATTIQKSVCKTRTIQLTDQFLDHILSQKCLNA